MFKAVLPSSFKSSAKQIGKDLFRFSYSESFVGVKKMTLPILRRTVESLKPLFKAKQIKVSLNEKTMTVRIYGDLPHAMVGDALAAEFLCWGTIGNTTFKDLMISATMHQAKTVSRKDRQRRH